MQHDYNIANQLFPATRADINLLAESIASNNLGVGFPATTFAGQWHYNETDNKVYLRDKANAAWVPLGTISGGNFTPYFGGAAIAQATETVLGIIKLATPAEAAALVETTKAITAAGLASVIATASVLGLTRYATQTEIDTLTATDRSLNVLEFARTWKFGTALVAAGAIARPAEANRGRAYYVTGSTTINTLWAGETPGKRVTLIFTGAPLLTNSANLILPAGQNFQAAAGDVLEFLAETSPAWRCISPMHYNGKAVVETNPTVITPKYVQMAVGTNAVYTLLDPIIPGDNSIPQITEGTEILTASITPSTSTSKLEIDIFASFGALSTRVFVALFQDAIANALNVGGGLITNTGQLNSVSIKHIIASTGSTTARTFRVRAGPDAAPNVWLNGDDTARMFGGASIAHLIVKEYLA